MRICLVAALLGLASTAEIIEIDDDTVLQDGEYIYREFLEGPEDCEMEEEVDDEMYVSIHYVGRIDNTSTTGAKDSVFHSTWDDNRTFDFRVGHEQAISALDEGLVGICAGAKVALTVPSEVAYGRKGVLEKDGRTQKVPGYATVRFEIDVIRVSEDPPPPENLFAKLDSDEDDRLSKDELLAFFVGRDGENGKIPDGLWDAEDVDQDGYISWEEFGGTKGLQVMTPMQRRQYLAEQEKLNKEEEKRKKEQEQGAESESEQTKEKNEL